VEHALNDVQHHSYLGSITHGFAVDSHCEQYNRKYRMYYFISTFQLVEIKTARTKQKHRRSWAQFCCKMWTAWCETNIVIVSIQKWRFVYGLQQG